MEATNERVVLITGAAGGLGQGLVTEFALQGWRVIAAQRTAMLPAESGAIQPIHLDVTNGAQCEDVVKQIIVRWGRLDALINNAGFTADESCWKISEENWERVLSVNLKGAFFCSRAALRPMLKQRDGHIINIGSFSGRSGGHGQSSYAAAKAGLLGLAQSLATELGSRNIRVNTVLPGILPTAMTRKLTPLQLQEFASANALGRINSVGEVVRFIVFLAGLLNISGQLFQLDSRIARWT